MSGDDPLASRSSFLVWLFSKYARWKITERFHAVRLARAGGSPPPAGRPLIIYCNHPSWWDPLMFYVLAPRCFPGRIGFGPMEAAALGKYGLFRRLGVFEVTAGPRGAARFLDVCNRVLERRENILWITAEGAFTDARTRPVRLRPGIAHLARRFPDAMLVPLALEYTFWNESKPEALARFGDPMPADETLSVPDWTRRLETALTETMDALAAAATTRDATRFETLTRGSVGVGGPYDLWRRLAAAVSGRRFDARHGGREA